MRPFLCFRTIKARILFVKISVVIIAFNEEAKIARALRSALWADEVLVVDSGSTDSTRQIAEEMGARVLTREWTGFAEQKQFAADNAANDWILSLDADEAISGELRDQIQALDLAGGSIAGYRIPRLSHYLGREIRHGGWFPDLQLRLFDRRRGRWSSAIIHESFQLTDNASAGRLRGVIHHYSVDGTLHHHTMIGERYAPLAARQAFENGNRTSTFRVMTAASVTFLSTYFLKLGFLDGYAGYCIARFAAQHAFLKQAILLELQNAQSRAESSSG
jgi:glycosyltransferase involved in cell wall biosynthesis